MLHLFVPLVLMLLVGVSHVIQVSIGRLSILLGEQMELVQILVVAVMLFMIVLI